jgi:hypothetical protein
MPCIYNIFLYLKPIDFLVERDEVEQIKNLNLNLYFSE